MNAGDCPSRAEAGNPCQHAFTLRELLAVLAMVGLLSLLVWPALASSNDNGTRTVCANNLRQMATAMTLYANENRDYLASPNWGNDYFGWLYAPVAGAPPNPNTNPGAYSTGLWFQYVKNPASYLCPADVESRYFRQRANQLSSYVMNGAVCGYSGTPQTCKISDVWSPNCYLLWEPDDSFGSPPLGAFAFNDASSYPDRSEGLGRVHTVNGAQVLTVGGNVQFVSGQQFLTEQSAASRSLAWWSPFSATGH